MDLDRWKGGKDLESKSKEEGEIMIRIYCVRIIYFQ